MDHFVNESQNIANFYSVEFRQLRAMFPQMSLTNFADAPLPDSWPGNKSLYELIVDYAHRKETLFVK